jgi:hypothetical protein
LDRGKLVGIITDRDVRLALNSPIVKHWRRQDEEMLDRVTDFLDYFTANGAESAGDGQQS